MRRKGRGPTDEGDDASLSGGDDGDWVRPVSAAERRRRAAAAASALQGAGEELDPVRATTTRISSSFWGQSWCRNLERYSDYELRLPRGRSYLRQGCVLDLKIRPGAAVAKVQGTTLYEVVVRIQELDPERWRALRDECRTNVHSLLDLLQGKLDVDVMRRVTQPDSGLFPEPSDIKFSCTCLDWADLCKHVAAVLYGIGVRLDTQPELLFQLRGVDHRELVQDAVTGLSTAVTGPGELKSTDLGKLFDLEMDDEDEDR